MRADYSPYPVITDFHVNTIRTEDNTNLPLYQQYYNSKKDFDEIKQNPFTDEELEPFLSNPESISWCTLKGVTGLVVNYLPPIENNQFMTDITLSLCVSEVVVKNLGYPISSITIKKGSIKFPGNVETNFTGMSNPIYQLIDRNGEWTLELSVITPDGYRYGNVFQRENKEYLKVINGKNALAGEIENIDKLIEYEYMKIFIEVQTNFQSDPYRFILIFEKQNGLVVCHTQTDT